MKLTEAVDAGIPLVVEIDAENRRIMAQAFIRPDGIVYADIG